MSNRRNPLLISELRKRRARGSNPQPLTGHHISSAKCTGLQHALDLQLFNNPREKRYAVVSRLVDG
jgi:hypothetical protein